MRDEFLIFGSPVIGEEDIAAIFAHSIENW